MEKALVNPGAVAPAFFASKEAIKRPPATPGSARSRRRRSMALAQPVSQSTPALWKAEQQLISGPSGGGQKTKTFRFDDTNSSPEALAKGVIGVIESALRCAKGRK